MIAKRERENEKERGETTCFEPTKQNQIKVPKVFKSTNKKKQ